MFLIYMFRYYSYNCSPSLCIDTNRWFFFKRKRWKSNIDICRSRSRRHEDKIQKMREEISRMRCGKDYMVEMVCDISLWVTQNEKLNILIIVNVIEHKQIEYSRVIVYSVRTDNKMWLIWWLELVILIERVIVLRSI